MSLIDATVRRFVRTFNGDQPLRLTELLSLAMAQVEPEGFEMARAGRRFFGGGQQAATGVDPVTAVPTTAAAWVLWNGEPSGGRAYAVEQVTIAQESGTAAVGGCILAALAPPQNADITAATGYTTASASGGRQSTKAVWAEGVTLDATPVWFALHGNGNPAVATIGGDTVDVKGRIVIPPGYGLALSYFSAAGTNPKFLAHAMWVEIDAYLE